jgi:Fic family protein
VRLDVLQRLLDQANQSLGRLLITFLLCEAGVLREPILYLSLYFKQHRPAYYTLLDRVRSKGDWETWLDFFLTGVRDTAEQAAAAARRILALFDEHRRKIEALGRSATSVLRIFEHMQRNPIVSIPAAAGKISISAPTVAKSLDHMEGLGMLREITGKQRHRLFVYDAYLAILSEGTEPLR